MELQQEEGGQSPAAGFARGSFPTMNSLHAALLFHQAASATGNLPFPRPKSLLQLMEKHVSITSFVVNDVKCFQSWEYMRSSADTPVRAKKRGES